MFKDDNSKDGEDDDFLIKLEEAERIQSHRSPLNIGDDSEDDEDELQANADVGTAENSREDKDDLID